ncbi:hypothetical protein LMANV2_50030 [Leptospira interrogans serovar Manilae]|uniref:Uncharacterized protein n=1 Tax=Leptospira interrogans serovar Manilae TaxID=214675 RepID=A0AAQ1SPM6_LEPIR|nr:hypothetical protein LMANV2_50030 [Leptospira interrogans serovar Manilae]
MRSAGIQPFYNKLIKMIEPAYFKILLNNCKTKYQYFILKQGFALTQFYRYR